MDNRLTSLKEDIIFSPPDRWVRGILCHTDSAQLVTSLYLALEGSWRMSSGMLYEFSLNRHERRSIRCRDASAEQGAVTLRFYRDMEDTRWLVMFDHTHARTWILSEEESHTLDEIAAIKITLRMEDYKARDRRRNHLMGRVNACKGKIKLALLDPSHPTNASIIKHGMAELQSALDELNSSFPGDHWSPTAEVEMGRKFGSRIHQ